MKNKFRDDGFSDKWSTYKYLTGIHSPDLQKSITSDFILAKLDINQKESIIELVRDAYYVKKEIEKLLEGYHYVKDKKGKYLKNDDGSYKTVPLSYDEQRYIKNKAQTTFNSLMIKIIMTKIEYRNVEKNVIMELITEKDKMTEESMKLERENKELGQRLKENIKKGQDE